MNLNNYDTLFDKDSWIEIKHVFQENIKLFEYIHDKSVRVKTCVNVGSTHSLLYIMCNENVFCSISDKEITKDEINIIASNLKYIYDNTLFYSIYVKCEICDSNIATSNIYEHFAQNHLTFTKSANKT